jgi:5-methylcytosine-specific restriction endonuclease McrA
MCEDVLSYPVLKLNKHWQALEVITVREAFESMAAGGLKALRCEDELIMPVNFGEWLQLEVREVDDFVRTARQKIRAPRVAIAVRFDRLHIEPPKLTLRNLRIRDNDTCIYTGRKLKPEEMSIEHLVPISKNGKHEWENVALADRIINSKRGNKDLQEAGLNPHFKPFAPKPKRPEEMIKNVYNFPEWNFFLKKVS